MERNVNIQKSHYFCRELEKLLKLFEKYELNKQVSSILQRIKILLHGKKNSKLSTFFKFLTQKILISPGITPLFCALGDTKPSTVTAADIYNTKNLHRVLPMSESRTLATLKNCHRRKSDTGVHNKISTLLYSQHLVIAQALH